MNCPNCSGLVQLGERGWLCAWCGRSGTYALGPVLRNGRRWRVLVTAETGRVEHHRAWVAAESMTHAERVAELRAAR
jgi:hypothetical protein